jgi:hypothetical protein
MIIKIAVPFISPPTVKSSKRRSVLNSSVDRPGSRTFTVLPSLKAQIYVFSSSLEPHSNQFMDQRGSQFNPPPRLNTHRPSSLLRFSPTDF